MRIYLVWSILILFSVMPEQSYSQDTTGYCHRCCCALDPTPAGVMISHIHEKGQAMFSYRYMNMQMNRMRIGTETVSDESVFNDYLMSSGNMQMDMHMLMGMYGITNRLTLMGMFHYNFVSMDMKMLPGAVHMHNGVASADMETSMKTSGIGDIKLHALYGLVNRKQHHLLLSGGISLPAGTIDKKGGENSMYSDQRLPYAMQLGSGSMELLPGISYLVQKGRVTWSSQISSVIRTSTNPLHYRWGNELSTNHWMAVQWANNFSSSLRLEATSAGNIKGKDVTLYDGLEPSANPYNYGGDKLLCYVGTAFHFRKGVFKGNRIGMEYGIPFYQNLYGPQMGVSSSLYASWSLSL